MLLVEASEIVPNLWQGSFPAPGRAVKASGFSMLVLCAVEAQEPPSSYPGVEVVHAPNFDDGEHQLTRELLDTALQAARRVTEAVRNNRKVLVTCRAGLNRSGLVTGLALHFLFGWDGDTCVRQVRKRRPARGGIQPLSNAEFTAALRRLDSTVLRLPTGWRQDQSGLILPV